MPAGLTMAGACSWRGHHFVCIAACSRHGGNEWPRALKDQDISLQVWMEGIAGEGSTISTEHQSKTMLAA